MEETRQLLDKASIRECPLCGNDHESVELKLYNAEGKGKRPIGATHYGYCPVTGDPVSLYIAADGEDGLDSEVIAHISQAQKAGRWLVMVCHMTSDRVDYWRKTYLWPKDRFQEVLDEAANDMRGEIGGPPLRRLARVKLPEAKPLFSLVDTPGEEVAGDGEDE